MSFALTSRRIIFVMFALLLCLHSQLRGTESCEHRCWTATVDLLVWYPSEEVAAIWADVVALGKEWDAKGFDFNWDYGFRLGLKRDLCSDMWDTAFYWTSFWTKAKHTIPPQSVGSISPEFFAAFLSGNIPKSMSVNWGLSFNMFDWELGRCCMPCQNVTFRPFIGIKGGWINQSIDASYQDLEIFFIQTDKSAQEHLTNNFWGIGPQFGVNAIFRVCTPFSLLGDFSTASLWGSWSCNDYYENTLSQTASVTTKDSTLGALMFRGFLGVGYQRARFAAKLGFETQVWLNQLRIATFQLQRLHHDLTFQGVTLSCGYSF